MLSAFGPLMVACAGRVLVPMRPAANVRLAIHTVTLRASRVLAAPGAARLSELNEAALALEEQLALLSLPDADTLRERIVEVEVAAGQHAFAASSGPSIEDTGDMLRDAIARLKALAHRDDLGRDAPALHQAARPTLPERLTAMQADLRSKLSWLPATRATTAALLAMLIGHSLSPERWFWAVITTFVVFLGTRSRADTVYRGAQRIAGTLAGALVSMLLASTLHNDPVLLVAAMVLCVFGWAYYILSAYAPGVFFITVLVGLVYGELGFAMGPLVELRIEEVMVGCLVSFAVAILLMPLAATRHVEARLAAVLGALREVVRLGGATAEGANSTAGLDAGRARASAMRTLDRGWHDLRIALRPLQTQRVLVWNPTVELATGSLLCCLHWARVLSGSAADNRRGLPREHAPNAAQTGAAHTASIVARLDALIARYNGGAAVSGHIGHDGAAPLATERPVMQAALAADTPHARPTRRRGHAIVRSSHATRVWQAPDFQLGTADQDRVIRHRPSFRKKALPVTPARPFFMSRDSAKGAIRYASTRAVSAACLHCRTITTHDAIT